MAGDWRKQNSSGDVLLDYLRDVEYGKLGMWTGSWGNQIGFEERARKERRERDEAARRGRENAERDRRRKADRDAKFAARAMMSADCQKEVAEGQGAKSESVLSMMGYALAWLFIICGILQALGFG